MLSLPDYCDVKDLPPSYEGQEILPNYESSIFKQGVFERQVERVTPFELVEFPHWRETYVELNNTELSFYEKSSFTITLPSLNLPYTWLKKSANSGNGPEAKTKQLNTNNLTKDAKRLKLIRSYTLQRAQIGVANDYKHKPYVLRLRIETVQMIIDCKTIENMIQWYTALSVARDLALPLELRDMPEWKTIPRDLGLEYRDSSEHNEVLDSNTKTIREQPATDYGNMPNTRNGERSHENNDTSVRSQQERTLKYFEKCMRPLQQYDPWAGTILVTTDFPGKNMLSTSTQNQTKDCTKEFLVGTCGLATVLYS